MDNSWFYVLNITVKTPFPGAPTETLYFNVDDDCHWDTFR